MKVTVRQLRGRPGVDNWHPLLHQLQETGISKFLVDVSTDNLADFFQQVEDHQSHRSKKQFSISGESCWFSWSILRLCTNFTRYIRRHMESNTVHISEYHRSTILRSTRSSSG